MIHKLLIYLLLIPFFAFCQECPDDSGYRLGTDIWLLAGQSNMVGPAPIDNVIPTNPSVLKWIGSTQEWVTAYDPINTGWYGSGYTGYKSLGLSFANQLSIKIDKKGRRIFCPIGLVSCAVSGSCISEWQPGMPHYNVAVTQTLAALEASPEGSRIAGILWLQGECDSVNIATATAYYENCFNLIINIREDLYDQNIPFILCEIGDFRPYYKEEINAAIRALGETLPYTCWVESQGLTSSDGGHHFNGPSLDKLGIRFAEAYLRVSPIFEPDSRWKNLRIK